MGLNLGKKGKDAEEGGRLGEGHGENLERIDTAGL